MSIIQQIRERYAAVSIAVIALSLVGFILMDALSSRSSFFSGNKTMLGSVNGQELEVAGFPFILTEVNFNFYTSILFVKLYTRNKLLFTITYQIVMYSYSSFK